MDHKLQVERGLRNVPISHTRFRERCIRKIQDEYGYSRDNAAKMHEYQELKGKQYTMNILIGGICAWKCGPIQREAALTYPLFRKTWMKLPIQGSAFIAGVFCANQLTTHYFPKLSFKYIKERTQGGYNGVTGEVYQGQQDLVSKFRMFENGGALADNQT